MKQFIKKGLCLTLLALCGVSAFAGGKVEVADDVSNGTITGQVSGTQVTLTVTPAEGFYIRKADLVAEKTFMPVAASRSTVPMADQLTIEGEDPADLSQQRTYTVTLPSEEYDVLVYANFTQRTMITREMVTVSETRFVYNTDVQRPSVSVGRLLEGRDYEVVFSDPASTEAGNYWLTVNGLSTYQGTHSFTYSIKRGGNAEVNSEILNGSVKAEVDGLTLTVTVIPADGYYFQKKNLRVDKTYMPVAARSTTPISDELVIVGDDPADLSLPRTYTVTMPGWEFDAWVDATFTPRTPLTDAMVKLSASSFVYNGNDQKPTVTLSGMTEGLDYTLIFAETEWKDVGSYSLSVRGESTYKGTVTKTFTITKAMPVVSAPVANELTFNREQQVLAQAGEVEGGEMLYSLEKNGTYTTTVPQVMDAGTYTLYYKVVGDSNHFDSEVASIDVSIGAKVVSNPTIEFSQQTFVYDGSAKEPSVTVKDGTDVIPASEYSVSYASNVNAGEATVAVSDNEGGNYTVSGSASFVIEKAIAQVMTAPMAKTLTYSGEEQVLIEQGVVEGGQMLYALDANGTFSEIVPVGLNAATYTVYYKVTGDANHEGIEVASVSVTIAPKMLDAPVIALSEQTYVYDGTAKEPSVAVMDGTSVIPASEYSLSYASNVNAGEAVVTVADEEGGNYVVDGQSTFTIMKATLNAIADNKMMEKGEPMPELTLRYKGFVNDETEEVILKQAVAMCEEITDTVAGIYQIVVSGGEAQNYDFAYVNGTLTVFVPVALADEAGNEVEASVTMGEDTCHVVITELTAEMLNGTQEIPVELKSGEGDTYQVTEVASEAFDEMPSNVIIELPDGISTTNPVTNVINGDGTCETLDLTDVDGFGTKKTIEVEEVIYEREVDSDVMTVCLPYSMEVPEDVSVFQLDADADGSVSFVTLEGDSLEAYQPYLMQPKDESLSRRASSSSETATLSLGAKNVTISPAKEDAVVSAGVFKLCGTVHGLTHAEGLALKAYVMQPDHTWQMTASSAPEDAGKTYLGAFQAYMQLVGGTGNEVIGTEINGTTAILHVTREAKPAADGWYDLMGRKLPGKPAKKGLYIYQGKKVRL